MAFKPPEYLQNYLNKEWRKPPENFVDCSLYYSGLDPFFIDYMNRVVRPCVAYSCGSADSLLNSGAKMNIGYSVKSTAVKLIKGDKLVFDGDDTACQAISETWVPRVNFESFLESAIDYMLTGGTVAVKLNKDRFGRCFPVATRIDRFYTTADDSGEVIDIVLFNSLLYSEKYGAKSSRSYWLVEERYYNKNRKPCVMYKVHMKSGVAGKETLPTMESSGIDEKGLTESAKALLRKKGIVLNKEQELPFKDGLGVWLWRRTANNSCVPGLALGDPLFYGILDLLWSADVVFSGSLTDVILGAGKVLVPKKYISTIREDLLKHGAGDISSRLMSYTDKFSDADDSMVYITTERDMEFPPTAVQFDIRAEQYRGMLETYLRQIVSHCGFAPTSVFPFLQDASAKTATEVTAEENLTRATVQSAHQTIVPMINRMLAEVLYQSGIKGKAKIRLSDYIGNTLLRDRNIRENYQAGLIPKEEAVQRINNISAKETAEYIEKLNESPDLFGGGLFNDKDYYGNGGG
jgi:hypothetical protein